MQDKVKLAGSRFLLMAYIHVVYELLEHNITDNLVITLTHL